MSEKTQDGWEKAEASGFIKFENPGDTCLGLLVSHQVKQTAKGAAQEYRVVTSEGFKSFLAPKGLHDALSGVMIKYGPNNAIVKIIAEEKIKLANGNDFWKFEVLHRKKTDKDLKEFGINEGDADPDNF